MLIILVAGFVDVALLGSFAMGPQVDREVATASKLQHRLAAVTSDTNFSRQRDAALAPPLVACCKLTLQGRQKEQPSRAVS